METTHIGFGWEPLPYEQRLLISSASSRVSSSETLQPASTPIAPVHRQHVLPDLPFQRRQDRHGQNGAPRNPASTLDPPQKAQEPPPPLSLAAKIGSWAIIVFSVGPFLILASMGFLAFLWSADATNSTWKTIVQKNWTITAVTMCSEVIKQVISFQLGLMVAMLAALALERSEVLISEIASFSMMRATAGGGTTVVMMWHYLTSFWYTRRFRPSLVSILTLLGCLLYGLVQVMSILLASDIDLVMIPGPTKAANTSFAFAYHHRNESEVGVTGYDDENGNFMPGIQAPIIKAVVEKGRSGTWYRKPPAYPTFAEYAEPPYKAEGVSDTGMTLRAFLPLQSAQERESLMEYSGPATVLDARVTCQSPELIDPRLLSNAETITVTGAVRAAQHTPRLGNFTVVYDDAVGKPPIYEADRSPFSCLVPIPDQYRLNDTEWATSICQLPLGEPVAQYTGGLISEFKDNSTWWDRVRTQLLFQQSAFYGNAYLILNVTTGDTRTWPAILEQRNAGDNPGGYRPPAYARRGEWYDMAFSQGRNILSVTLCHTAFDFAHIPVNITSTRNRTEPAPVFNSTSGKYTFPHIIRNLLGEQASTAEQEQERGILTLLPRPSWIANGDENNLGIEPWIRSFADLSLSGPTHDKYFASGNTGNLSALLYGSGTECFSDVQDNNNNNNNNTAGSCKNIDPMHMALFQEIVQTNQSVAFALQAMITVLSGMAYYDQLPQFDNSSMATAAGAASLTFFETATAPVRKTGLLVVGVAVAAECFLAYVVVVVFLRGTTLSRIGATWSVVAQASSGDVVKGYMSEAGGWSDGMVAERMRKDGVLVRTAKAGLVRDENTGEVQVAIVAKAESNVLVT